MRELGKEVYGTWPSKLKLPPDLNVLVWRAWLLVIVDWFWTPTGHAVYLVTIYLTKRYTYEYYSQAMTKKPNFTQWHACSRILQADYVSFKFQQNMKIKAPIFSSEPLWLVVSRMKLSLTIVSQYDEKGTWSVSNPSFLSHVMFCTLTGMLRSAHLLEVR